MIRNLTLAAALLSGASAAHAAPTYIHAGRLIAVPAKAVRGPSTIVVDGGRIQSVHDGFVAAAGGRGCDRPRDRTVLPGLIDSHVHLDSTAAARQELLAEVRDDPPLHAFEAQMNGMKMLRAGFTTVRNLGDDDGVTMALRDAVKRGWVQGPRIIDAGQPHLDHRRPHGRSRRDQRRLCRSPARAGKSLRQRRDPAAASCAARSIAAPM